MPAGSTTAIPRREAALRCTGQEKQRWAALETSHAAALEHVADKVCRVAALTTQEANISNARLVNKEQKRLSNFTAN